MLSQRNKYWLHASLWLLFLYGSIPFVRPICEKLREVAPFGVLVNSIFVIAFILICFFLIRRRRIRPLTYVLLISAVILYAWGLIAIEIPEERVHFLQYGILAYFIYRAMRLDIKGFRAYAVVIVMTFFLGWIDEGIQHLTPGRYFGWKDVFLNAIGGILGLFLNFIYRREMDT